MASGNDRRIPTNNPGYRKGTNRGGSGGGNGGGGKNGRPVGGWEKGDIVRDTELPRTDDMQELPVKPGRRLDE